MDNGELLHYRRMFIRLDEYLTEGMTLMITRLEDGNISFGSFAPEDDTIPSKRVVESELEDGLFRLSWLFGRKLQ